MKKIIPSLFLALFILGCGEKSSNKTSLKPQEERKTSTDETTMANYEAPTPETFIYRQMTKDFIGSPSVDKIKPMMEEVMTRHRLPVNVENLERFAGGLINMRKESKVGVTEMEILKHMYQKGSSELSLSDQAGLSGGFLEENK